MNVGFRLNEDGEYDRLSRLNELKPGDIFKLRQEDGTFLLERGLQTPHWVLYEPVTEMTVDFRYCAHVRPLLLCWAAIQKLHIYFCEHFAVTDYAMVPQDLNRLCKEFSIDTDGWKTEEFPKFVLEFTSEEKKAVRDAWWKLAMPALKIDNELYIKSKAS